MKEGYIPKDQRKKILLLSDDLRMPSGVGTMSREIVTGTAHHFNWVQLGAAVQHPEIGNVFDLSDATNKETGLTDASVKIIPYNGYGDANAIRSLIMMERPDAILHFTDPRYWIWLYQIEHEIREHLPLMFYHVWDALPYPKYNEPYYRSCDFIASISRQTYNIVKRVWKTDSPQSWQTKYIPHGVDKNKFFKYTDEADLLRVAKMKKDMFGSDDVEFVVTYNSRNIRRKMTGDIILAYKEFFLSLPEETRSKVKLLLHTQPVDENGTDLVALVRDCAPEISVVFSANRVEVNTLNDIYNISDVVINLSCAEGFGLGTLEAIMSETMIIVNVTGGLQDQCGFMDDHGHFLSENVHYNTEWGSNSDGRFRTHGEWVEPVFPAARVLVGSPPTPYIFEDHCTWQDASKAIRKVYDMGSEERARRGKLGREYAINEGYEVSTMCQRFIDGIDSTLVNWSPRKRFKMIKS